MNPQFGNGVNVFFDDLGPRGRAPVILIRGHPFHCTTWAPRTAAPAAAGYRVIAPDLRGCGESPVVPGRALLADQTGDIAAPLARLGIEQVVVGGVSTGGRIAMEPRLRHSGVVRARALCDTPPEPETEDGAKYRRELAERLLAGEMEE